MINAAGPFSDEVRGMSDAGAPKMIMASSGVHVTLPDYYSPDHLGMIVPKTKARPPVYCTCLEASDSMHSMFLLGNTQAYNPATAIHLQSLCCFR